MSNHPKSLDYTGLEPVGFGTGSQDVVSRKDNHAKELASTGLEPVRNRTSSTTTPPFRGEWEPVAVPEPVGVAEKPQVDLEALREWCRETPEAEAARLKFEAKRQAAILRLPDTTTITIGGSYYPDGQPRTRTLAQLRRKPNHEH